MKKQSLTVAIRNATAAADKALATADRDMADALAAVTDKEAAIEELTAAMKEAEQGSSLYVNLSRAKSILKAGTKRPAKGGLRAWYEAGRAAKGGKGGKGNKAAAPVAKGGTAAELFAAFLALPAKERALARAMIVALKE